MNAEGLAVRGRVRLLATTIGSREDYEKRENAGKKQEDDKDRWALDLAEADIESDFQLFAESDFKRFAEDTFEDTLRDIEQAYDRSARELHKLRQEQPRLKSDALSRCAEFYGDIRLSGAKIRGNVVITGAVVHGVLEMRDTQIGANLFCDTTSREKASAEAVKLDALDCPGKVDLTGLKVSGNLSVRNARIRGILRLVNEDSTNEKARVDGALLMEAAQVNHLILSGECFEGSPENRVCMSASAHGPSNKRLGVIEALKKKLREIGFRLRGGSPDADRPLLLPKSMAYVVLERALIGNLELLGKAPESITH